MTIPDSESDDDDDGPPQLNNYLDEITRNPHSVDAGSYKNDIMMSIPELTPNLDRQERKKKRHETAPSLGSKCDTIIPAHPGNFNHFKKSF